MISPKVFVSAKQTLRSAALGKQVPIPADRSRERTVPHELALDLDDLGDRSRRAGADNEPGPFSNDGCFAGVTPPPMTAHPTDSLLPALSASRSFVLAALRALHLDPQPPPRV